MLIDDTTELGLLLNSASWTLASCSRFSNSLFDGHRQEYKVWSWHHNSLRSTYLSTCILISGEIGWGKTTLIRHLLNKLPPNLIVGLVLCNAHRDITNMLEWIMLGIGLPYEVTSGVGLFDALQRFLTQQHEAGEGVFWLLMKRRTPVPMLALEPLRTHSYINADKSQLIQIILAG